MAVTDRDKVIVRYPSFPKVILNKLLAKPKAKNRWQVLCGDRDHFRVGLYSPEFKNVKEIERFEKHSCPEFFLLLKGQVSIAILGKNKKVKVIKLKPLQPLLVEGWHCGFCPKGKYTGVALVVERDQFTSWYVPSSVKS